MQPAHRPCWRMGNNAAPGGIAVVISSGMVWLRAHIEQRVTTAPPEVQQIDIYRLIVDDTPVQVTVTAGWEKVTEWTTYDAVGTDTTLWRRMHVHDWDRVPTGLRERALESMLTRYRHVLASPSVWDRMGPQHWDRVPQPIRALAYRHMVEDLDRLLRRRRRVRHPAGAHGRYDRRDHHVRVLVRAPSREPERVGKP